MYYLRSRVVSIIFVIFLSSLPAISADHLVLVVPDNIVTQKSVQAIIYEDSAEFFAGEIINSLNKTKHIKCPTVSAVREKIKSNSRLTQSTARAMKEFREGYNINYLNVKKIAQVFGIDKVLLITSSIDSRNYIIRRSVWDFLNIPGASVIDPAFKISIYAVLVDTKNDIAIWSNTYYKTISIVESRMVAVDYVQSTQQLEKIRDYSHSLAPTIAKNIQLCVLPSAITANKNNLIDDGFSQYDNDFTKKYRKYKKNTSVLYNEAKENCNEIKSERAAKKAQKEAIKKTLPPKESVFSKIKKKYQNTKQGLVKKNKPKKVKVTPKEESKPLNIPKTDNQSSPINSGIVDIKTVQPVNSQKLTPAVNIKPEPSVNDILKNDFPEYIPSRPRLREGYGNSETINDL